MPILEDMGIKVSKPILLTDSKAAFDSIKSPSVTKKSVHLERWLQYAREQFLRDVYHMLLVSTHNMMADGMTKVVDREKFFKCCAYMMNLK